jgi:hypothetical protein
MKKLEHACLTTGYIRDGLSAMVPTDWNNKTFTFGIPIILEYSL